MDTGLTAQERYAVQYHFSDKDTSTSPESLGLRQVFSTQKECFIYLQNLVKNKKSLGFLSFSIDSVAYLSNQADVWIFIGQQYTWEALQIDHELHKVAEAAGVLHLLKRVPTEEDGHLSSVQDKMLNWLENNGYPFAAIYLDSFHVNGSQLMGKWKLEKGPLYKIDSIHVEGAAKISVHFLAQYLDILPYSLYNKDRLNAISRKLRELNFLEETSPWDLSLVGTGATVNLYLKPKRNSQVNALIGFLPANRDYGGKTLLTGEVNINLRNAIGNGELIGVNWQQIQIRSPRLNLIYEHPYMFNSGYGAVFQFDVFKKDSSFIHLNAIAGLSFKIDQRQQGKLFYQRLVSNQITVDTNSIKQTKRLPEQLDVRTSLIGLDYQFSGTDYRYNPRKGTELNIIASAGLRKIVPNSFIDGLKKDATGQSFNFSNLYDSISRKSYVVRFRSGLAHYIQTNDRSTVRLSLQTGFILSKGVYRNELFQIGGYKLLRGFNEESIYTDRYMVTSAEYRYLIGQNAFLYAFSDLGWARTQQQTRYYWGNGIGLSLETKAGYLNLSYAVGKQQETSFSLREAKIHFGFVSIF